jgi:hypothetical protein
MQAPSLTPLIGIGSRAVAATARPLAGAASAAVEAGIALERRAVELVFDSPELERAIGTAIDSPRVQSAVSDALSSKAVQQILDEFVSGGAFDALVDSLLASDGLWRLIDGVLDRITESPALWRVIDEVAASPAVTAAITQQGLGFADQVGAEVRSRSRRTDDLLERVAHRLTGRRANGTAGAAVDSEGEQSSHG